MKFTAQAMWNFNKEKIIFFKAIKSDKGPYSCKSPRTVSKIQIGQGFSL